MELLGGDRLDPLGGFQRVDLEPQPIAVGFEPRQAFHFVIFGEKASLEDVLLPIARAKQADVSDLVVCILDRPRHAELIAKVREAGARIMLISDGDVSGVIATSRPESGIDIYMGSGGAPEGVLAAAALRCIGGHMQGRLLFRNDDERGRARRLGIKDFNRKYGLLDLAKGDVMFAATGVTNGTMLQGVRRVPGGAITHSMVMRSKSGTVRVIEAQHNFQRKTHYGAFAG